MTRNRESMLPTSAVDLLRRQSIEVDLVEATQIDRAHVFSIRRCAMAEGMNAARRTKDVVRDFFIELVVA